MGQDVGAWHPVQAQRGGMDAASSQSSSPVSRCHRGRGHSSQVDQWPWCGDSCLDAHGDLCGHRAVEEPLSLLTALEWGGLAVPRLPVSWSP